MGFDSVTCPCPLRARERRPLPSEEKDEPLYRHPVSEEELISGVEVRKADDVDVEESEEVAVEPAADDEGGDETRGIVVSLLAPDVEGDYVAFVSLPERLLIVEEQEGESDLGVVADAVESRLAAPYRARALRVDERRFVVVASEIETVELPGLSGDELLVFALPDGERTAVLDGKVFALAQPELEPVLEESAPCLLKLVNVDESVWELTVDLL
jgi:hypothetical protein